MTCTELSDRIIIAVEIKRTTEKHIFNSEKYSSGRRGAPAKGIGRVTGARVQIPPSPPYIPTINLENVFQKVLTSSRKYSSIVRVVA